MNEDKLTKVEWALVEAARIIAEDTGLSELERRIAVGALADAADQMEGISELGASFVREQLNNIHE